jgi:soluble lytic murein transglycosylase
LTFPFADAVALGDCGTVLAAPLPAADAAPLARARCLLRTGRGAEVAAAVEGVPDALRGYARLLVARAAIEAGDRGGALTALEGVSLPGAAGLEVKLLRAVVSSDVDALLALGSGPRGPEAKLEAAAVLARTSRERALAVYREVWLDARPGGADARAHEALVALGADPTTDPALRARRLAALQAANRVEDAQRLVDAAPPPTTAAGWEALGEVRYAARDYPGALDAWAHVYGPPADAEGPPDELFRYALCHARADDYDTAAVVYRRVMATAPTSAHAEFAAFKLGYMEYDRGRCAEAVPLLEAHRKGWPTSKRLDESLWWTARCAEAEGDPARADASYAELLRARPSSSLAPGAAYWQARHLPDPAAERAALEKVRARWPDSGYAWLAAERLGVTFPPRAVAPAPPFPAEVRARPAMRRFESLAEVGLREWAADELSTVSGELGAAHPLATAEAWLRAGRVDAARALACKRAGSAFASGGDEAARQLCWPRIEAGAVAAAADGVPAAVVYGVMTAESALDPAVSSAVGARGLMQLMPSLGAELHARWFPDTPYDPDALYSAPYNTLLGATELADRTRSLAGVLADDSLPAVIASYNAGEEAVRRWAATGTTADAFVEAVGYVETRGYVKRVLGAAMTWRAVWGDPPPEP